MQTTAVIFEILVTGFFALSWIVLIVLKLLGIDISLIGEYLKEYKEFSTLIILIAIVICYQIGWLINSFSHFIFDPTIGNKYRNKIFDGLNYDKVKIIFYQNAVGFLKDSIGIDRSVIRLARGGLINFPLIFLALEFWGGNYKKLSWLFLILAFMSFFQYRMRVKHYCNNMKYFYLVISKQITDLPDCTQNADKKKKYNLRDFVRLLKKN
jgi:hypothetical protein